ncbi:MAG: protein phosphatase 2C domain-containing protein [Paracoccaceae bacterium]
MLDDFEYLYDAATAAAIGRRDLQEDAIATHFPAGSGLGYIVLADGMGGHAAGDVASKIVVQEFFEELQLYANDPSYLERNMGAILRYAMDRANGQVARHTTDRPDQRGMGSTLVAPLIVRNHLYWISVGDSPLYLLRGDRMSRLNQEHSVASRLSRMVVNGLISQREADQDPDRYCLTSVLLGADVPEIDCRDLPLDLLDGDILIVASDGLLFLDEPRIAALVYDARDRPSAEISAKLLQEIRDRDDPDQDNVSLCVVKVCKHDAPVQQSSRPATRRTTTSKRTTVQLQVRRKGKQVSRNFSAESEG